MRRLNHRIMRRTSSRSRRIGASAVHSLALSMLLCAAAYGAPNDSLVRLPINPPHEIKASRQVGPTDSGKKIELAITLPLRNQKELSTLLEHIYTPNDPLYHQYLTPEQFTAQFGPTQQDYDAVAAYVRSQGLTVSGIHPNRAILDVEGSAAQVEAALGVRFLDYAEADGRVFYAADVAPRVPASIAGRIGGIIGLNNARRPKSNHVVRQNGLHMNGGGGGGAFNTIGTGHNGGLAPSDIRTAYDVNDITIPSNGVVPDGTGQILGLIEFDGYEFSAIRDYEIYYGLPDTKVVNTNVDGGPSGVGGGEVEVSLDIEMMVALAPKSSIYVYQSSYSDVHIVDTYNKVATDNKCKSISTSWYTGYEYDFTDSGAQQQAEAVALQEMAAQGQSMFAASGDYGATDINNSSEPNSVQDPASQPYITSVGGTTLSVVNPGVDMTWDGEVAWSGSGGGISDYWSMPSYQAQAQPEFNGGSAYARNVPDVSLNADPNSGYDQYSYIYGGWITDGGTSAASPLWAAFVALVNQGRAAYHLGTVGFVNPMVYGIYYSSTSGYYGYYDFHDIQSGNNTYNLPGFTAGGDYDDVTGLGSFDATQLFYEMVQSPSLPARPLAPSTVTAVSGDTTAQISWSKSNGAVNYFLYSDGSLLAVTTGLTYKVSHLTNGNTYYFYVIAQNSGGSSNYSAPASAVPNTVAITGGPSAAPVSGKATITWTTNVLSNSVVTWGTSSGTLNHTVTVSTLTVNHSVTITGVPTTHGTTIYYKVSSKDDAGITTTSGVNTFTTP